ncbi:MAG: ABC transporter permease subunit [Planctomycetes bacterium]|nr:ABC transporter permease subunit [Planctomycetota bacterium]
MSKAEKVSSPLKDSLRLFIRNKPSVLAMIMILLLAGVAVTGHFYVGNMPDEKQFELIENAEIAGDVHGLEITPTAVWDPSEPILEDYFISPGGKSRVTEGKTYWMGTDHLGRDVMARLWAGSSISLTIGFLAVSISLLLGISLGGIAGYYGRSRVAFPILAMFILLLSSGIAWAADFTFAAIPILIAAFGFFIVLAAMAIMGGRYKSVVVFFVTVVLAFAVYMYVGYVETTAPEGRIYTQAAQIESQSLDVVRHIRSYGKEVRKSEDGRAGANSKEWMQEEQFKIELEILAVEVEVARFVLIEHNANIEMAERMVPERKTRIEHLGSVGLADSVKDEKKLLESDKKRKNTLADGTKDKETALADAEAALKNANKKGSSGFNLQNSNELLERRADFRGKIHGIFMGKRTTSFEGFIDAKLLSGHQRYSAFRFFRGLGVTVVLILLLVISSLMVAGAAQASASESKSPLKKLFVPTITVDDMVMRYTEIMMAIPVIYLILMVLALFERDVYVVMAIIGLTSWMGTTRFVRAEILALREQDFVQAARALGIPELRIIWRHLVPNAISPVLVSATLGVATAVLTESTLSFLGIGAGPDQNTWGKILAEGRTYMLDANWLIWIPGIAILVTVLSFNLLGEGLREAFNPKLRGR